LEADLPGWKQLESRHHGGHEVALFEKERKLGGMLPLAGLVKGFEGEE
jgi:hypothetical protein